MSKRMAVLKHFLRSLNILKVSWIHLSNYIVEPIMVNEDFKGAVRSAKRGPKSDLQKI